MNELSGSATIGRTTTAAWRAGTLTDFRWPRRSRTLVGFGANTCFSVTTVGNSANAPFGTVRR